MKLEFFTVDDEHRKFIFPRNSYKKLLSGDAEVVSALEHAKKYKAYEVVEQDYKKPNRAFANLNKDDINNWIITFNPSWENEWKIVMKQAYFLAENASALEYFKIKETKGDVVKLAVLKKTVKTALASKENKENKEK